MTSDFYLNLSPIQKCCGCLVYHHTKKIDVPFDKQKSAIFVPTLIQIGPVEPEKG